MIRVLSFVLLLNIICCTSECVGQERTDESVIRSFLTEILNSDSINFQEIADKYMIFKPMPDSLIDKRNDRFKKHLALVKEKYATLYDSSQTKIRPYKKLKPKQKIPFDETIRDHVYAVFFDRDKLIYFVVEDKRIKAFDNYMIKGEGKTGRAYFLVY